MVKLFDSRVSVWGCLSLFLLLAANATSAQESASFKMRHVTATLVADRLTSTGYINSVTAVEIGGTAGVCPTGAATTVGFWSVLGPGTVPVLLAVDKSDSDPDEIDLLWTGQATEFSVYAGVSPVDLANPANLIMTTGSCSAIDSTADEANLLFYVVHPSRRGG